ncbi:predicted protein [Sclerotinia sclerotiorum 1980 UF-70]|uniref:Uncharacterized protein n=1 Tax=Sclerotinia sclerotiorum (strain ATCC 18683 / 1980 / Ss-1) TaxID=665079 RepID=A7ENG0_SCLS1|nr:predicted protein [Sclerotinia sclerotiorum 1980 UF-70]EDO04376.1 predicted protein [Sclerotinia sclerotiorum 1980 UF-70]
MCDYCNGYSMGVYDLMEKLNNTTEHISVSSTNSNTKARISEKQKNVGKVTKMGLKLIIWGCNVAADSGQTDGDRNTAKHLSE